MSQEKSQGGMVQSTQGDSSRIVSQPQGAATMSVDNTIKQDSSAGGKIKVLNEKSIEAEYNEIRREYETLLQDGSLENFEKEIKSDKKSPIEKFSCLINFIKNIDAYERRLIDLKSEIELEIGNYGSNLYSYSSKEQVEKKSDIIGRYALLFTILINSTNEKEIKDKYNLDEIRLLYDIIKRASESKLHKDVKKTFDDAVKKIEKIMNLPFYYRISQSEKSKGEGEGGGKEETIDELLDSLINLSNELFDVKCEGDGCVANILSHENFFYFILKKSKEDKHKKAKEILGKFKEYKSTERKIEETLNRYIDINNKFYNQNRDIIDNFKKKHSKKLLDITRDVLRDLFSVLEVPQGNFEEKVKYLISSFKENEIIYDLMILKNFFAEVEKVIKKDGIGGSDLNNNLIINEINNLINEINNLINQIINLKRDYIQQTIQKSSYTEERSALYGLMDERNKLEEDVQKLIEFSKSIVFIIDTCYEEGRCKNILDEKKEIDFFIDRERIKEIIGIYSNVDRYSKLTKLIERLPEEIKGDIERMEKILSQYLLIQASKIDKKGKLLFDFGEFNRIMRDKYGIEKEGSFPLLIHLFHDSLEKIQSDLQTTDKKEGKKGFFPSV